MPRYRYTGSDADGRPVTGERDATDSEALLASLAGEVPHVASIQLADIDLSNVPAAEALHRSEASEVSGHIAEIIEAQLPLESGLAAIAAECPSKRMRRSLTGIAGDLALGTDLETVLARRGAPAELKALVRAGARSGNTGQILEHYVINVESMVDLRQSMRRGLLYPLALLMFFGSIGSAIVLFIVPQFIGIFDGFDMQVPVVTAALIATHRFFARYGVSVGLGALALIIVGPLILRALLGRVRWRRWLCRIPLVGSILRWTALARFSQLLSLLVENRVPLGEALTLAGDASGDAEIQDDCRRMLADLNAGETLASAARRLDRFPSSFVQALGWENRPAGLPEVLQSLGDMYAGRVRAAVAVIIGLVPPLLMLLLGVATLFLIVALFLPLFQLLNLLS